MKLGFFTRSFLWGGGALVAGLGLAEAIVGMQLLGSNTGAENTLLAQRIANGREIRQALSTPLPPLEPLPPITAKVANAPAVQMASSQLSRKNPWSKTNSLPPEAINAMAKSLTTGMVETSGSHESAFESYEKRTAPSRSVSRSYASSNRFDRAVGSSGF
jgi:hypothetical protein